METIEFTSNYSDLSTEKGFQFEFTCNRCGSGFRTTFQPSTTGTLSTILDTAGSIFGGILGTASNISDTVHSAGWTQARDSALSKAIQEIKPHFVQCPKCSEWVCKQNCWNEKKGLCKQCAPDLGVEMAAAQSSKSVEEVWAHAKMSAEDKHLSEEDWRKGIRATCPSCNKPLSGNVKFCPECGAAIHSENKCKKCGSKLEPNAKFCPECGEKTSSQ